MTDRKTMGNFDEDDESADVKVTTDAKFIPAAEIREREMLAANAANDEEPEFVSPMAIKHRETLKEFYAKHTDAAMREVGPENPAVRLVMKIGERVGYESTPVGARLEHPIDIAPLVCPAATRVKRNGFNHTIRCQHAEGHEGGHEARDGARLTIWYGEAQKLPGDERYRFGINPHWMMQRKGRKTMAADFDSED